MKNLVAVQNLPMQQWLVDNWQQAKSIYPHIPEGKLKEYIIQILSLTGNVWRKDGFSNIDCRGEFVNVFNGIRHTVGGDRNKDGTPRLLVFGDSRVYGSGVDDASTVASQLQDCVNKGGLSATVLNYGVRSNTLTNMIAQIDRTSFKDDDVILFFLPVFSDYAPKTRLMRTRANYWLILQYLLNRLADRNLRTLVFKFPDIRRLKFPNELERFIQTTTVLGKKYTLLDTNFRYTAVNMPVRFIDCQPAATNIPKRGTAFWDYWHPSPLLNKEIAKFTFPFIKSAFDGSTLHCIKHQPMLERNVSKAERIYADFKELCAHEYAKQEKENLESSRIRYSKYPKFDTNPNDRIGAIVMNCNPFSNGHLYLIEEALKKVDWLYVFIVNEDKSTYSFEHRLFMVRKHFSHNPRVKVLPSGKLMISSLTFPDYFTKESADGSQIDSSMDIAFFGNIIAKIFNINVRFAGTEPLCKVTQQYNETMRRELPKYGIDFVEIERKCDGSGKPISASYIRKCIAEGNLESLQNLIPPVSYEVIKNFYIKNCSMTRS